MESVPHIGWKPQAADFWITEAVGKLALVRSIRVKLSMS